MKSVKPTHPEGAQERILSALSLSQNELELMEHSILEMEHDCGLDRNAALADMRYTFIESVCARAVEVRQAVRPSR